MVTIDCTRGTGFLPSAAASRKAGTGWAGRLVLGLVQVPDQAKASESWSSCSYEFRAAFRGCRIFLGALILPNLVVECTWNEHRKLRSQPHACTSHEFLCYLRRDIPHSQSIGNESGDHSIRFHSILIPPKIKK